jgi:hypothetical protein
MGHRERVHLPIPLRSGPRPSSPGRACRSSWRTTRIYADERAAATGQDVGECFQTGGTVSFYGYGGHPASIECQALSS